jgi:hypothetical protein
MSLNKTHIKFRILICGYLSDKFRIQTGLKQGDALWQLLFDSALQYSIRKVHEKRVGLKLNGKHQLLVYADDVNLLEDYIDTVKKKTQKL